MAVATVTVAPNSTSVSIPVQIVSKAAGTPTTGVVAANITSATYTRVGAAPVTVTTSNLAAATTAFTANGFIELTGGLYRFDIPNAAFLSGVAYVHIKLETATAQGDTIVQLGYDLSDNAAARIRAAR